jgi:hypothetical protein
MQAEQLSLFDDFDASPTLPCPFLGRKVVATGSFTQSRQALRSTLLKLGASEVRFDKLQRNTHFLLTGDCPDPEVINYWLLYVHDGYNIRRLTADDLQHIQGGDYSAYQMPEDMPKELHLTHEHVYWVAPEISGLKNTRQISPLALNTPDVLYGKEIFVHPSIMDSMPTLAQALGCLGAYANTEMDEMTDSILIPGSMPKAICRSIEEYYNASKATLFNIPFIILEDLITYIRERVTMFPDEAISQLLENLDKK